jgi:hypothetical protein
MPQRSTRLVVAIALLLGLAVLSAPVAPPASAGAPSNDTFGHALKIGSLPYHHEESTRHAKAQGSDPEPSCSSKMAHTVWFTLKRGSDTSITADTLGSNINGGTFDTVLVAYQQTGRGTGGLVEVDCTDDSVGDHLSQVTFTASANKTYYLMVGSYKNTAGGHLELNVATP